MNKVYFLALLRRPGDYKLIDISKLNISNHFYPVLLNQIDYFTMQYSTDEIINAISLANLVDSSYLSGNLVIIDQSQKKPLQVIDKEMINGFDFASFIRNNWLNKEKMNNIIYKLAILIKDDELISRLKELYRLNLIQEFMMLITSIEYPKQRKFMLYLIDLNKKEKEKKKEQQLLREIEA